MNAVSINNQRFNYATFQLNTLDYGSNTGVKNIAYYDTNNELYLNRPNKENMPYASQKNIQRMALRKLEYNPDTFRKLLSLMLYGAGVPKK